MHNHEFDKYSGILSKATESGRHILHPELYSGITSAAVEITRRKLANGFNRPNPVTPISSPDQDGRPFIFVGGFLSTEATHAPLISELRKLGVLAFSPPSAPSGIPGCENFLAGTANIETICAHVAEYIDRVVPRGKSFDLGGHSLGGLVAIKLRGIYHDRIHHLIAYATPFKGTPLAFLGHILPDGIRNFVAPVIDQLEPGSNFLKLLSHDHVTAGFVGNNDRVVPYRNQFSDNPTTEHIETDSDHWSYIMSNKRGRDSVRETAEATENIVSKN